jgi:phosphate transport system permease protein
MKKFWRTGEPWVWGTGAALAITLLIAATLIIVIMVNGLGVYWPDALEQLKLKDGTTVMGELVQREEVYQEEGLRRQYKIGNREIYGLDFRWIDESAIAETSRPEDAVVLEREENGNFYGYFQQLNAESRTTGNQSDTYNQFLNQLEQTSQDKESVQAMDGDISDLSYRLEELRREQLKLKYNGAVDKDPALLKLQRQQAVLQLEFKSLVDTQNLAMTKMRRATATFTDAGGQKFEIVLADIVDVYRPNQMSVLEKVGFYLGHIKTLIFGEPRESNTEGGLYPAIFGTVMLIFIMSLFSFPLGVIAAVYLREYAKEGMIVRLVRIAVNNLAGIPSIVYGIFGLGFFVYGIGSTIDQLFFPEVLPTPTFGTGGILWASLTLALLTVPVVIVSTEEALGAIPREIREGSLALGSTKFQTLMRILLPMASPGIMTGLILSMARAAGEVAPLMITGVVKLAPTLPIDGNFPFFHLDRKFMHLGFHIFDIGFQSPNVEAAKPMVFVTTLLLVLIVLTMSGVAIYLRNRMKKRYTFSTF